MTKTSGKIPRRVKMEADSGGSAVELAGVATFSDFEA